MQMPWDRKKRSTTLIIALVTLGCAAGVALGLVLAPQAGDKTRSKLRTLARRGFREVERATNSASKKVASMPFPAAG